jgi:iron complex transport system substrate-binding protein
MGSRLAAAVAVATLLLAIAGCGEASSGDEQRPSRIVSLSPSATETLFAVGAGDQVIAVDEESANLDDAYAQMRELGRVTGHAEAGERLAVRTQARVERLIATAPDGPRLDFFHEIDPDLFSTGTKSFIGRIYQRLGLRNVADPAARRAGTPYPQMSSEAVVSADPDLIVLADTECCDQSPAKVARRPGWQEVAAVEAGAIVAIDDDIASRWGPRIPVFVAKVVEAMQRARAAGAGR